MLDNTETLESNLMSFKKLESFFGDGRQVVDILQTAGALEAETTSLLPLGRTAVAVRGVNELWLALAIRSDSIVLLTPSQLAAACGTLVSEEKKTSSRDSSRFSPLCIF